MNAYGRILDLESAVDALQKAVSVLQEELKKAKAPPKPEIPWDSGRSLLDEFQKKHAYGPQITDHTRSKWPQHQKPAPVFLKFEHPRRGVPS